jgi:putative sigma-54 modulation protein
MNIIVRGKKFKVGDNLKEYAQKRVGKLSKYSDDFTDVNVVLSGLKGLQKVEVTAPLNGVILRGEEETDDMRTSIDLVVEKLERQIERYKKRIDHRRGRAQWEDVQETISETPTEEEDIIVRTKKFVATPMTTEEAIMQMNLLSHSFYVFLNAETGRISVVYRRQDQDYGLLEPDY